MKISIVTFNTYCISAFTPLFFAKCKKIAELNDEKDPCIINFQEVFFYHHFYYLKKILHTFPYYSYSHSLVGPKGGLVTFSRLPLENYLYEPFTHAGYFFDISMVDIFFKKGILISKLKTENIYIFNTHFSANFLNDWETENKYIYLIKSQIKQLHNRLRHYNNKICLIVGDFNIPKKSSLYPLLKRNKLRDVFLDINRPTYLGDFIYSKKNNLQIDYIFTYGKARFKTLNKKYIFNKKIYISDHAGLKATLILDKITQKKKIYYD